MEKPEGCMGERLFLGVHDSRGTSINLLFWLLLAICCCLAYSY